MSPQTSIWSEPPRGRTSTSQSCPGRPLGEKCVQVAPESELWARPQLSATHTLRLPGDPGAIAMPWLEGSVVHDGSPVAGFDQVAPPSVLRQIPAWLVTRPS